jgi:hypothetical protein
MSAMQIKTVPDLSLGNKSFARPISSPHCFVRRGAFMRTVVLAATVLAAHDMSSSSPKMCLCEIIVDLDWARWWKGRGR